MFCHKTLRNACSVMASVCNFIGIIGLDDGIQFMPADKKHYWKHDAYIPMPSGDFPAEMLIYGSPESTAVDKGIYFVAARALLAPSANVHEDDASLQLYANCVSAFLHKHLPSNVMLFD